MSVERVVDLLRWMSETEREDVWRALKRHGIDVEEEGWSGTPEEAYKRALQTGPSDKTRAVASMDPKQAYLYALNVEGVPHEVTRNGACDSTRYALRYAMDLEGPHDTTRNAVLGSSRSAIDYAIYVDKSPHDATRKVALISPRTAVEYASQVDKAPRDDTRAVALKSPFGAWLYARNVDKCYREDTWRAVRGSRYEDKYRERFNLEEEEA